MAKKHIASRAFGVGLGLTIACNGVVGDVGQGTPGETTGAPTTSGGPTGGASTSGGPTGGATTTGVGAGTGTTGAGTTGTGGGQGTFDPVAPGSLLPARIRRLTSAEYDASVTQLLGVESTLGKTFTPDARQDGFSANDAQRVDPVFAMQADDAACKLAAEARARLTTLAPCANPTTAGETCARTFAKTFAARAYRRPPSTREIDALVTVYRAAAAGATYADGIEVVIQAVLESPGFLYLTEIGDTPVAATTRITSYEAANAIGYLFTGAPPDATLSAAATSGELSMPEARRVQATRLFGLQLASIQLTRVVEEWLGVDRITETAKDSKVYASFSDLKNAMKQEADDFMADVMWRSQGNVSDLLSADWTPATDELARMYLGTPGSPARTNGRVSLASVRRRGILNQAAFLSVYAHASETAPVLRGVALLRRLACIDVPSPSSLNINVIPPVPDPTKTTRERFTVHSTDAVCATCHSRIDAFGFSFENFDGMGQLRTKDNGRPVDSSTIVAAGADFDGRYADSSELVVKLATSPSVSACFARHLFRYAVARSDAATASLEQAFVDSWNGVPSAGNLRDVLVSWVGSDAFMQRRAAP